MMSQRAAPASRQVISERKEVENELMKITTQKLLAGQSAVDTSSFEYVIK